MPNHLAATEALRKHCNDQISRRYDRQAQEAAQSRLNQEWNLVEEGHVQAFQFAAEVSRFTAEQKFACKMIGAGSCSIIPFLLNLSEVDPLQYRLPAERLLALPRITFTIVVDPKFEAAVRKFGDGQPGFAQTIHIHPATRLEIIPIRVVELIRRNRDPKFDLRKIPTADIRTAEFFGTGDFGGIFQLETDEIQRPLRELKPRNVERLTAILTAVQINSTRDGLPEEFVERAARDHDSPHKPSALREPVSATNGLVLYQEQIMLVLHRRGGLALQDGYEFVKQAAKRKNIAAYRDQFLTGAVGSTVSQREGETLFAELEHAARYALCKSHQLANATTTWQSAYLKTHFRREFEQAAERNIP